MKKIIALALAAALLLCSCAPAEKAQEDGVTIAASFYPVYITLLNIADGVEGVRVESLVDGQVGCLHDYTLTTAEMKIAEAADALVINGAGMEPFMDKIAQNMPELEIIDASAGIELFRSHEGENPHVWLDVKRAIAQLDNISSALCTRFPEHAAAFSENAARYRAELSALDVYLSETLAQIKGAKLVTFHEAFDYFAHAYGLEIAAAVHRDEHTAPSPAEVEGVIRVMEQENIRAIFTEPQYHDSVARTIADAAGAAVYTLDPAVSGEASAGAYISTMRENAQTLLKAFG